MNHKASFLRMMKGGRGQELEFAAAPAKSIEPTEIAALSKQKSPPTKPKPTKAKPKTAKSGSPAASGSKSGGPGSKTGPRAATVPPKMIADNRKTRQHYEVLDSIECGMILLGSEVKSLRNGKCQLDESYGRVKGETLWLIGCNIAEYPQATVWNHEPKRPRQLLIHKREMSKFIGRAKEKGLTLVPLKMYFNERGVAKCEMALCKGLKLHDKRDKLKKADAQRDMQRAVRRRG